MTDDMGFEYENVGNAIVRQAHLDYLDALLKENKAMNLLREAARAKEQVFKFYGSDWYYSLTQVDPETLVSTARKQADYIIWQKRMGCGKCEFADCEHKKPKANWKLWDDNGHQCPRSTFVQRVKKGKQKSD